MTPTIPTASSRTLRIYIAGPMTGLPEWNFPAFNAKAAELRELGWHVENPAEHGVQDGVEWADYLRYDLTRIATCEAMYLLPGWSNSRGARLEVHIGKALDMMFYGEPAADHDALPASTQPVQQDTDEPDPWALRFKRALLAIKYNAVSLADAQVIALRALNGFDDSPPAEKQAAPSGEDNHG